jgi:hypothetical protein
MMSTSYLTIERVPEDFSDSNFCCFSWLCWLEELGDSTEIIELPCLTIGIALACLASSTG